MTKQSAATGAPARMRPAVYPANPTSKVIAGMARGNNLLPCSFRWPMQLVTVIFLSLAHLAGPSKTTVRESFETSAPGVTRTRGARIRNPKGGKGRGA